MAVRTVCSGQGAGAVLTSTIDFALSREQAKAEENGRRHRVRTTAKRSEMPEKGVNIPSRDSRSLGSLVVAAVNPEEPDSAP
jgi:hypothetical protein